MMLLLKNLVPKMLKEINVFGIQMLAMIKYVKMPQLEVIVQHFWQFVSVKQMEDA